MTEETMPVAGPQAPEPIGATRYIPDPALCLTPDVKGNTNKHAVTRKVRFKGVRKSLDSKEETERQPRCTMVNDHKLYNADIYTDFYRDDDELFNNNARGKMTGTPPGCDIEVNPYTVSYRGDKLSPDLTTEDDLEFNDTSFINIVVKPFNECRTSISDSQTNIKGYGQTFCTDPLEVSRDYAVFARPEYNTTLVLGEELNAMRSIKLHITNAVEDKIKTSEHLKTAIGEKAALQVNYNDTQFKDLVTVSVSEAQIVTRAEKNKPLKSSRNHVVHSKIPEPDIMEFYTDDLQPEPIDLSLDYYGIKLEEDKLIQADLSGCYDLFLKNLVYNGKI